MLVIVGAGAFVVLIIAPILVNAAPVMQQGHAFGFFLLIYAGLALGVSRYRLFDLDEWAFRVMFYTGGVALLLAVDALLLYVMHLQHDVSFSIALLALAFIYLPARDTLRARLQPRGRVESHELFREVVDVTFDPAKVSDAGAYVELLRDRLPREFPGVGFSMLPADIATQILNFGLPAPLDIQIAGAKRDENLAYLHKTLERVARVPGVADARLQQQVDLPTLYIDVDRSLAQEVGLSEKDVTLSLQTMLSGSQQSNPTFWLNVKTGVSYPIVAMEPQYWVTNLDALSSQPVSSTGDAQQILAGVASIRRGWSAGVVTHYTAQPAFDIYANVRERDLGAVADDIEKILDDTRKEAPAASNLVLRGQVGTMRAAYGELLLGLVLSIVFVYLVIVVNFQSWLDPFLIICCLPTALAGIVWMLFLSDTTISVPALTGAIMCMGVATANSNLIVAFARERLDHGDSPEHAAAAAGVTRFRPVIMTALAMIIGMAPMALSAEQNAPLGRAVIGGLTFATTGTLLLLPVIFSLAHGFMARRKAERALRAEEEEANVAS